MSTQAVTELMQRVSETMKTASLEKKVQIMIRAKLIPLEEAEAQLAKARAIDAGRVAGDQLSTKRRRKVRYSNSK